MDSTKEDDLAAKREARRKRILENAKDRLTRITGREDDTEDSMETSKHYFSFQLNCVCHEYYSKSIFALSP